MLKFLTKFAIACAATELERAPVKGFSLSTGGKLTDRGEDRTKEQFQRQLAALYREIDG